MRRVDKPEELAKIVEATQSLAEKSFGDGTIYLERLVAKARHIEIQVFGFGDGNAVHLFERECSIQRRFQKIVEETPAPGLAPAVRRAMAEAAVALVRQERYRGPAPWSSSWMPRPAPSTSWR
jgi:Acetyl/propionyl-CoA carboxylase, alpha subunit